MQEDIFKRSKAPLGSVALLFVAVLVAGVVVGGLASLVGRFIYLIIIFPVVMGMAAGFVIDKIVVTGKIRSIFVVVAAGIFAAVLIYGSMHTFDYFQFRSDAKKEIQKEVVAQYGQPAPEANVQAFIDEYLVKETGSPGLIGFILLEAKEGVSISHATSGSGSGINLGAFTWVYWLIELGIIGWMAVSIPIKSARNLFCEHCDAWVAPGVHIGGVKPEAFKQTAELIQKGDFTGLTETLQKGIPMPSVEFYTRTCKTCNTFPFYLTGTMLSPGQKGQVQSKLVLAQALDSSQRFALTTGLAAPRTPEHVRTEL